ncbi:MAG: hypothetical protein H0T53_03445 [Herpetosiphonaceae bacterium]|nr:hypothetical protein [Herpetosiphonaceae bacterium]
MRIHDQVAELSAVVASLQSEVAALRAGRRRSRLRALVPILSLLCLLSLSLTMIPATRAQSPDGAPGTEKAAPADSDKAASPNDTGGPLLIGNVNQPSNANDTTTLRDPSSTQLMQTTLRVDNYSTTSLVSGLVANRRVAIVGSTSGADTTTDTRIGVLGASDTGTGVLGHTIGQYGQSVVGFATGANSDGVLAYSSGIDGKGIVARATGANGLGVYGYGGKYGAEFQGGTAPILLTPNSTAGPPTAGRHQMGELVVSSDGHLWFCRATGTPGKWVRLDLASTFVPLIQK